jgi:hypothetical protein
MKGVKDTFKSVRQGKREENVAKEMEIEEESSSCPSKDDLLNPRRLFQPICIREAEDEAHSKLNIKPLLIQTWFLVSSRVFSLVASQELSVGLQGFV